MTGNGLTINREFLYYIAQYAQIPKQPELAWVFAPGVYMGKYKAGK